MLKSWNEIQHKPIIRHHKIKIVIGIDNRIKFYCDSFDARFDLKFVEGEKYSLNIIRKKLIAVHKKTIIFSIQENIFSFAIWHDSGRNTITPGIHDAVTIMKSTRISKTIRNVSVRTLCGHCILWSVHIASDFVQFPSRRWANSISHNIFVIHTFCKFEIGNENRQRA